MIIIRFLRVSLFRWFSSMLYIEYFKAAANGNCPRDAVITTRSSCEIGARTSGLQYVSDCNTCPDRELPSGCFYYSTDPSDKQVWFNDLTDISSTNPEKYEYGFGGFCMRSGTITMLYKAIFLRMIILK